VRQLGDLRAALGIRATPAADEWVLPEDGAVGGATPAVSQAPVQRSSWIGGPGGGKVAGRVQPHRTAVRRAFGQHRTPETGFALSPFAYRPTGTLNATRSVQ
jgi:hypothetical protein